jgi:hypothetical protein
MTRGLFESPGVHEHSPASPLAEVTHEERRPRSYIASEADF